MYFHKDDEKLLETYNKYFTKFKVKEGDKDKNNKLMSFHEDDGKLLEKCKAIWTKIEDSKKD